MTKTTKPKVATYIAYKIAWIKDTEAFKRRGKTVPVLHFGDYPYAKLQGHGEVMRFIEATRWGKGLIQELIPKGYYRIQRVGKNYYEMSPSTYIEKRMGRTRYLFKKEMSDMRRGIFNCETDMFEPPHAKMM